MELSGGNNRRKKSFLRMENLRRVVQLLVLGVFVYLFASTAGKFNYAAKHITLPTDAPVDIFFYLDPLLGLSTMLSTRQIIEHMLLLGIVTVLVAVVAGRFFCGWICPMGTLLDVSDHLFYRKRKVRRNEAASDVHLRKIKYYILGAIVAAAAFGSQIAYMLDPFAVLTRTMTFAAFPSVQLALKPTVQYFFRLNFFAAIMFVGIIGLNSISRRFWCRNLCPLGAMLALLSRFSVIRRRVTDTCPGCAKCVPDCKMGAIQTDKPTEYNAPECIYCYSCTNVCPTLATSIVPTIKKDGHHTGLDLSRRRIFQAAGIGVLAAVLGKTNAAAKTSRVGKLKVSDEFLIRPPGSRPEEEFIDRCMRCSECMKVCPTNGLQPALTEAGFEGLWTPVLVPSIGECTQLCNLCSQVCASRAIEKFEIEEKPHIYIGRAVIDRSKCIVWNSGKQCLVCDEYCSYHAVYWKTVDGVRMPFVDEHKCVGCGICESACPIQPRAAIRVYSFGDKRHQSRDEQKAFFESNPRLKQPHVKENPYQ